MADLTRLTARQRIALGLLFIGVGFVPFSASIGVGPVEMDDILGPPWLGLMAGSISVAFGFALLMGDPPEETSALLGVAIVAGLAAMANWGAVGGAAHLCSASSVVTLGEWAVSGCIIAFGYGAALINVLLLLPLIRLVQKLAGGPPRLAWFERVARGLRYALCIPVVPLRWVGRIVRRAGSAPEEKGL